MCVRSSWMKKREKGWLFWFILTVAMAVVCWMGWYVFKLLLKAS